MLENSPVYYDEATNTWHVFKHKDVLEVLTNYEYFSSVGTRTTIPVGADNKEGSLPEKKQISISLTHLIIEKDAPYYLLH